MKIIKKVGNEITIDLTKEFRKMIRDNDEFFRLLS